MLLATLVSSSLQNPPHRGRQDLIRRTAVLTTVASAVSITGLVFRELQLLSRVAAPDLPESEEMKQLRSANELAPDRARLVQSWRKMRREPAQYAETKAAFEAMLRVRIVIAECEELARSQRWEELGTKLPVQLVTDLESAATILASSSVLGADERRAIGWQWGACGWRQCGAQADAAQALCKLRANLGMIVPIEALFYLDVAKRAVDEVLALGVRARLLDGSRLPHTEYLPRETLEMFLVTDNADGDDEASWYLEQYEAAMLEQLNEQLEQEAATTSD